MINIIITDRPNQARDKNALGHVLTMIHTKSHGKSVCKPQGKTIPFQVWHAPSSCNGFISHQCITSEMRVRIDH